MLSKRMEQHCQQRKPEVGYNQYAELNYIKSIVKGTSGNCKKIECEQILFDFYVTANCSAI